MTSQWARHEQLEWHERTKTFYQLFLLVTKAILAALVVLGGNTPKGFPNKLLAQFASVDLILLQHGFICCFANMIFFCFSFIVHMLSVMWPKPRWPFSTWYCTYLQIRQRQVSGFQKVKISRYGLLNILQRLRILLHLCTVDFTLFFSPHFQIQQTSERVDSEVRHVKPQHRVAG